MKEKSTDKLYDSYVSTRFRNRDGMERVVSREPLFKQVIARHFPKEKDLPILELGCGHGALIYIAQQYGYKNIRGVDISEEQVTEAKKIGLNNVFHGDLMEFLEKQKSLSVRTVISIDVIEHLDKGELLKMSEEVNRVLLPEGEWLIHAPNAASPFFGRVRYGDYTHKQAFTKDSLSQVLLAAGFERVRCYEEAPVADNLKRRLRWIAWKLVRSVFSVALAVETGRRDEIFSQNLFAVASKIQG